jgi:hypothetical protein
MQHNLFYKYRTFGEYTYNIILNSEFYFPSPLSFNDPFDCNLSYRNFYTKEELNQDYKNYIQGNYVKDLNENFWNNGSTLKLKKNANVEVLKNIGVFSMSKSYKNILMWSHYADEHKGLVFELDMEGNGSFFNANIMRKRKTEKVKYVKEYKLLSYLNDEKREVETLLLYKYKLWKYEKEYRIINFGANGSYKFNKKLIKKIYFGCKADETNIKKIIQLCQLNGFSHVKFKKAKLISGKFALDFDEINKNDYLES